MAAKPRGTGTGRAPVGPACCESRRLTGAVRRPGCNGRPMSGTGTASRRGRRWRQSRVDKRGPRRIDFGDAFRSSAHPQATRPGSDPATTQGPDRAAALKSRLNAATDAASGPPNPDRTRGTGQARPSRYLSPAPRPGCQSHSSPGVPHHDEVTRRKIRSVPSHRSA